MPPRWAETTTDEVAPATTAATVLLPVGSCEQHGPHLPLDTDTRIAVAVAEGAAAARPDTWVAPAIAYGASGEHQTFAGTVSIGHEALASMLVELGRSLGDQVSRLVFVNGHGGNADALRSAVDRLRYEGRPVQAWSPRLAGRDAHAGRHETSLLLALAPELVRLDRAAAGAVEPLADLLPAMRAGGVAAVSPNGVLGDPTGASADEGLRTLAALVDDLVGVLAAPLPPRPDDPEEPEEPVSGSSR